MPNFGHESDQNAIMKRLRVFKTQALPHKDGSVTCEIFLLSDSFNTFLGMMYIVNLCLNIFIAWLRRNCMTVFHYCAEMLKNVQLFESCTNSELLRTNVEGEVYYFAMFNRFFIMN